MEGNNSTTSSKQRITNSIGDARDDLLTYVRRSRQMAGTVACWRTAERVYTMPDRPTNKQAINNQSYV